MVLFLPGEVEGGPLDQIEAHASYPTPSTVVVCQHRLRWCQLSAEQILCLTRRGKEELNSGSDTSVHTPMSSTWELVKAFGLT